MSNNILIVSTIITTITAISSIIISVYSLRQNTKLNKEANRANITIYLENINVSGESLYYIIVKNFGKTGARINYIHYNPEIDLRYNVNFKIFSTLKNHFIAPGQSIRTACPFDKNFEEIEFKVSYNQGNKEYIEEITINFALYRSILSETRYKNIGLEKSIQWGIQNILENNL